MVLLPGSLFVPAEPVHAGGATWSAETIPDTLEYVLGPDGAGDNLDVRDFSFSSDGAIVYAAPGDSVSDNVVYKSIDSGLGWDALEVEITADLVTVCPDDRNIVVIANSGATGGVYFTTDGGTTWYSLGIPQQSGGAAAATISALAISPLQSTIRYIAVAGRDTAGDANLWILNHGASIPAWKETKNMTGFSSGDVVADAEFSPGFTSDLTMVAVSADYGASPNVQLQVLSVSTEKWNYSAYYTNFPRTVVSNSGITGILSASLALAPDYLGTDDDYRRLFIGLTINGNASAIAESGIYRYVDTLKTDIRTNVKIHSVACNGSYLVAGSYDTTTVYRSSNPFATSPTVLTSSTAKRPGGENRVKVAWKSTSFVAGTGGNESAFSVSADNGKTFNDISLIDTVITNATDVAVSSSGDIVYLVTDDGNDLSLWKKATYWQRIFSKQGTTDYIIRIARQDPDYIYLAQKGATTIYNNNDGGLTQWSTRTCSLNIQDIAVESTSVLYAISNTGMVSKSINSGLSWPVGTSTYLSSGATIVSVSTGTLMAGSQDGHVAYSTDSGQTWDAITNRLELGAGNLQIVPDEYYATNHIIYAASSTPGQNIKKCKIGSSTVWTDIFIGNIDGGIYGLAVNNNTLYALEYDPATGQSTLWLCISPTSATATSTSWSSSTTTTTTDANDATVSLNAAPRALKASTGKLWAVKTNGTNKLYSYDDVDIELSLNLPAMDFVGLVNNITGIAHDVCFTWDRPTESTEYELEIALDEDFFSLVTTVTVANINQVVGAIVGPGRTGGNYVNFIPGNTYYWRIRTSKPVYSRYSVVKLFRIESVNAVLPAILSPPAGHTGTSRNPAFSWAPVSGATEYQFVLSANASMAVPIIDIRVNTTAYAVPDELDYGGTYFWRIRSILPIESDWSPLGIFTVMEQPAGPIPPVVTVDRPFPPIIELPSPPPQNTINVLPQPLPPEPVVPDYLRVAIIIASVILVSVITLIVVPLLPRLLPETSILTGPFRGPTQKAKNYIGKKWGDMANRLRELAPSIIPPPAADKTASGDTISFAVRSFLLITSSAEEEGQRHISVKEERALGKKLASGIRALAKEKPLYLAYPEDAFNFLQIWSRYGSRDETSQYLKKTFKSRPENALALLKCFQEASGSTEAGPAGKKEFTRANYDALIKVVDPDSVYVAISKLLKFRFEKAEDETLENAIDRAIAYQFVRIHYDIKK